MELPPASEKPSVSVRQLGLFQLVVACLVFITISRAHDYLGAVGALRPGLILFAAAMGCLLVFPASARFRNLVDEWPSRVIWGLLVVGCLAALTGLSLTASGAFLTSYFFRLISLFALVALAITSVRDLRFLMGAYVAAMIFLVPTIIFVVGVEQVDGYSRVGETSMYDGNDLGVVFLAGLPFALLMAQSGGRLARLLGWAALIGVPLCVVLTASRGGFLALAASGLAILFLMPGVGFVRRIAILGAASMTMTFAAPEGYWDKMATILNPADDYNLTSETGRMAIWTRGMGYVAAYPVFGVGPDNFVRAGWLISDVGRAGLGGTGLRSQAPHNTFLQVWAELGTVGLILWMSVLIGGIFGCLRTRSQLPRSWLEGTPDQRFLYLTASYIPVAFIGFAVATFFTSHAYTGMFYILAAFLAGFHLLLRFERGRTIVEDDRTPGRVRPEELRESMGGGPPVRMPARTAGSPLQEGSALPLPTALNRGRFPARS